MLSGRDAGSCLGAVPRACWRLGAEPCLRYWRVPKWLWWVSGYYWLTGRVDDVINVSGHRIGTAEVLLRQRPARRGRAGYGTRRAQHRLTILRPAAAPVRRHGSRQRWRRAHVETRPAAKQPRWRPWAARLPWGEAHLRQSDRRAMLCLPQQRQAGHAMSASVATGGACYVCPSSDRRGMLCLPQ